MYGFHKGKMTLYSTRIVLVLTQSAVSDVFHTGSPDSPLWEFKHGAGSFKRGDLVGLREIKRRASRHTLIHRESFSNAPKMPTPGPAGGPLEAIQDPIEARFGMLEWQMSDVHGRLLRTEEAYTAMASKCQSLLDGLIRCHNWNEQLSTQLLSFVPDPDNPIHREVYAMRQDISRHADQLRVMEEPQDSLFTNKHSLFQPTALTLDPPMPISPRQRSYDESRRPSLQAIGRPNSFRAPVPTHLQVSPRRYGSIGTSSGTYSPSASSRPNYLPPPPPPQPPQHPLATMSSPPANLARRHTSADIRVHGWSGHQNSQYNHGSSPYASGQSSSAWPSSPRANAQPGDQQLRDALAQYELPRAAMNSSRQHSPPPPHELGPPSFNSSFGAPSYANTNDAGWQIPGAGPRYHFKGIGIETPGPPTRRSSMASNVHSLLNPADTAEREGEDEGPDERKRKRLL